MKRFLPSEWPLGLGNLFAGRRKACPEPVLLDPGKNLAEDRQSPLTHLYDDIGRFLFAHSLDLTPLNFGCVHDYLSAEDRELVRDMDRASRDGWISNGWIEDYAATHTNSVTTAPLLEQMVRQVEGELDRNLTILKSSADRAKTYGEALDAGLGSAAHDAVIDHIAALTREMIAQTRLAEAEMRASHAQISELRTTLRAARKASKTDALTGLLNRRGFERRAGELCAAGVTRTLSVAICDLDHFKQINDRFGHEAGDRVLQLFAHILDKLSRRDCIVARLGGEEFAILFVGRSTGEAATELDAVRETFGDRNLFERTSGEAIGQITFSAGISAVTAEGLFNALRAADGALYAAKRTGRNRVRTA